MSDHAMLILRTKMKEPKSNTQILKTRDFSNYSRTTYIENIKNHYFILKIYMSKTLKK